MRYTIQDKIRLLKEQQESGLNAILWCEENDVTYGSFKNFAKAIRDYNFTTHPAQKRKAEKKCGSKVAWISAKEEDEHEVVATHVEPAAPPSDVPTHNSYIIEIGQFKIHVPTNINTDSLQSLLEVLRACS